MDSINPVAFPKILQVLVADHYARLFVVILAYRNRFGDLLWSESYRSFAVSSHKLGILDHAFGVVCAEAQYCNDFRKI